MARFAKAAVAIGTGSETASAPGGMTMEGELPKVRAWRDAVSMLLSPVLRETDAAPTRSASVPNSLVRRTRNSLPATEVWTTSRSVESTRVGTSCQGSPSNGEAAHVLTHKAGAEIGVLVWA